MKRRIPRYTAVSMFTITALASLLAPTALQAQLGRGAKNAKDAAPVDLTGYWVSIVSEDWRFRMMTPAKGDYPNFPLNAEGRAVANAWDPAKDEAAGDQCKAYGAGGIMHMPERLHITWDDDNTLKLETDTGKQTRLFHFGKPQTPGGEPTWQGYSLAQWDYPGGLGTRGAEAQGGSLKVVTTHLRPGYLQKNGVPYSANAVFTEHVDLLKEANGDQWLIVTTLVEDPQYLSLPFQTSVNFRRQRDATGWDPEPCTAR